MPADKGNKLLDSPGQAGFALFGTLFVILAIFFVAVVLRTDSARYRSWISCIGNIMAIRWAEVKQFGAKLSKMPLLDEYVIVSGPTVYIQVQRAAHLRFD